MDDVFTGYDFSNAIAAKGLSIKEISSANKIDFLTPRCQPRELYSKTWYKKVVVSTEIQEDFFNRNTDELAIASAIKLLKANNYKILQPVNEYKEI